MRFATCIAVICAALAAKLAVGQTVIGVVHDGPVAENRELATIPSIAAVAREVLGNRFEVDFPGEKQLDGGWTLTGVRDALQRQLDDPAVDIVLTTGLVASHEAARIPALSKPVIAAVVADSTLQQLPVSQRTAAGGNEVLVSGKDNYVYLSNFRTIDDEITTFHTTVGFDHLTVLVDALTEAAIPELARQKADELEQALAVSISILPVTDAVDPLLAALPADTDAVYVTPLLRLDQAEIGELATALIERNLPSFSLLGRPELEYGLLMATSGRDDDRIRFMRRIALNLERILLGENAGTIEVLFQESRRPMINMATAAAIGFAPSYAILTDAEEIYGEETEGGEPLLLGQAMAEALEANLELRAASFDPLISAESIGAARSALLPRLGFGLQATAIDEDRANPLFQSERMSDATLSGSQVIYSDDRWSQLRAAEFIAEASNYNYSVAELDTMQAAATAYLTVLRARSLEEILRLNLEVTRSNRDLARIRQSVGFSGRAEVLRWESQLSTDLQNLIGAEADRRAALTAMNRILNRPQNLNFTAPSEDIARSIAVFDDDRFQVFIDNAVVWETFQDFSVDQAIDASPELKRIDELIGAQERELVASQRKHWVPEVSLGASAGSVLSRSGAGSNTMPLGIDDESWSMALSANWPVFAGGAIRARINTARYELAQLEQSRAALAESIEARTRLALHRASGSYPAIEPARAAADAAQANLEIVTDAYSQGVVSVTDLVDAQNAALAANLRAADTQYAALIDVIDVFRSSADFSIFLDPGSTEAWFQEVEAYFRAQGVEPRR